MKSTRRQALALLTSAAAMPAAASAIQRTSARTTPNATRRVGNRVPFIPQTVRARVIVDNDFAGDPDGLVSLAHQLLSEATRVTLITSLPLNPKFLAPNMAGRAASIGAGYAQELLNFFHGRKSIPVISGPEAFTGDQVGSSDAARAIVAEALREDPLPLFFACGGPLTNLAAALRRGPRISKRMTVVWIGGGDYPRGAWEYNMMTDIPAAKYVIEQSRVRLWQVPLNAYRQMQYSVAQMNVTMRRGSRLARWLYTHFTHPPAWANVGGTWPLGDSPLVLLTALSSESSVYVERQARRLIDDGSYGDEVPGRSLRVYESVDARLTFDDMEALLELHG